MAYRIEYDAIQVNQSHQIYNKTTKWLLTIAFMAGMALAIYLNGWSAVEDLLIPGDPQVTRNALEDLVYTVRCGGGVAEAFADFCRDVIAGASVQ